MATLTKNARQVTVPETEVEYYLAQGWQNPNGPTAAPAAFPAGEPSGSWKAGELKAYASAHGIDLGGMSKKSDILEHFATLSDLASQQAATLAAGASGGD